MIPTSERMPLKKSRRRFRRASSAWRWARRRLRRSARRTPPPWPPRRPRRARCTFPSWARFCTPRARRWSSSASARPRRRLCCGPQPRPRDPRGFVSETLCIALRSARRVVSRSPRSRGTRTRVGSLRRRRVKGTAITTRRFASGTRARVCCCSRRRTTRAAARLAPWRFRQTAKGFCSWAATPTARFACFRFRRSYGVTKTK